MAQVHLTRPEYEGRAACQSRSNAQWEVTHNVMRVTCRACLKAFAPERSLAELRAAAKKVLDKR